MRWVINGVTAVKFTWRWDVDSGGPLRELLIRHRPSRMRCGGLALIKPTSLLGAGELEVAHLHDRAEVCCRLP
jgi:hypothetical protein